MAGSQNQESKKTWDITQEGMRQLEQINAMERQQDVNMWSSGALFAAANGVLLLALFNGVDKVGPASLLMMCFGNIGLFVCLSWVITAVRARTYEGFWIGKAKALQKNFAIPPQYGVWNDEPPKGIPSWCANLFLMLLFVIVWSWMALYGAYSYDSSFLPLSVLTVVGVALLSLGIVVANWWRSLSRESCARKSQDSSEEHALDREAGQSSNQQLYLQVLKTRQDGYWAMILHMGNFFAAVGISYVGLSIAISSTDHMIGVVWGITGVAFAVIGALLFWISWPHHKSMKKEVDKLLTELGR